MPLSGTRRSSGGRCPVRDVCENCALPLGERLGRRVCVEALCPNFWAGIPTVGFRETVEAARRLVEAG